MLQVKNVTFTHRKDLRVILDNFQLTLNPGDKCVIIGEEGNGKSTLLKWIYDPAIIDDYIDATGERILQKERLGYLPQELPAEEENKTLLEYFSESPLFYEKSPKELAQLAKDFTVEQDFFYLDQPMKSLSGGEKIKAQLMRLLLEEPTVLLLDEPSNDLDLSTLAELEKLILHFPGIVLFISHDETLIERVATMVVHLEQVYRKRECRYTVARVPYREYRKNRLEAFDKQEQIAYADLRAKKERDERYRRILDKVDRAQATVTRQDPHSGQLLKKKMHAVKSLGRRFEREDESMTERPILEEAINFRFEDGTRAPIPAGKTVLELDLPILKVSGVSDGSGQQDSLHPFAALRENDAVSPLAEAPGNGQESAGDRCRILAKDIHLKVIGPEKICLIGQNGCGKTTLLRQIASLLQDRQDIKMLYMPQNYQEALNLSLTPVEFLCETLGYELREKIQLYLGALRFTFDEMRHPMRELSGGQKAKVFLLRMTLSDCNVLVLDEPTRNFSPLSGPVIRQMLSGFSGAIISVSHDRKYIQEVATRVYELTEEGLKESHDW